MQTVIQTVQLTKYYRDFWGRLKAKALDHLNLTVYEGEILGLLGPNGSGKTTTIKLLLGLLNPSHGHVRIFGKSPRVVKNKKYIGFLPEETYLYPYQNAEEALYFYGRLFGIPRNICAKRVDDLLEMVGLTKARKRPLKEYSKGMARRIGIAQALINDPKLIFLDEPTTGLDPIGTREIKDLILQLKEHGKTVLLCSHLLADVEDICDRISILYGGKIRCEGTVKELLSNQEETQLTFHNIDPQKLEELQEWLQQNRLNPTIEKPQEKLETFFLNIIQQARNEQQATSGAEAGKLLQNFFTNEQTQPDSEMILNNLIQTEEEAPQEVEVEEPKQNYVLDLLTQNKEEESFLTKQEDSFLTEEEKPVNHDILNNLLK